MAPVIPTSTGLPIDSLLRRLAVEVFAVGLRVVAGMVDDAVPMIRRRIERIELHRNAAIIDDVVIRPGRDDYREAGAEIANDARVVFDAAEAPSDALRRLPFRPARPRR